MKKAQINLFDEIIVDNFAGGGGAGEPAGVGGGAGNDGGVGKGGGGVSLEIVPMTLKEANAFVVQHHRHHKPTVGHKFSIGCSNGAEIVGVVIVGRPVSRHLDDGWTLDTEPGTSLKAAGWKCVGQAGGLRWTGRRRPKVDLCPAQMKIRWEVSE